MDANRTINELEDRIVELEDDSKRMNRHLIQISETFAKRDQRFMKLQTIVLELLNQKNKTSAAAKAYLENDDINPEDYLKRRNIG